MTAETSPWFTCRRVRPDAALRLFCFPYAGASGAIYRSWHEHLPSQIEVCPIELPGRWGRIKEAPFTEVTPLIEAIAAGISRYLDLPFVLLGYSMGAVVSFELARHLRRRALPAPRALMVMARRAPHMPSTQRWDSIAELSDVELVDQIVRGRGVMPVGVLQNPELLEALLPALRADMQVLESHVYTEEPPLDLPIHVCGGERDPWIPPAELTAWAKHTTKAFSHRVVPGDHFFIHSAQAEVLGTLALQLGELLAAKAVPG